MKSPPTLVLASTSVYRRALLERLNLPFTCVAPGVDETPLAGEAAVTLVTRLARAKAWAVATQHPEACVVGSDQIAVLGTEPGAEVVLGKPGTVERCLSQLRQSSGQTVRYLTAVAVIRRQDGFDTQFLDTTRVTYRSLEEATLERYVSADSPLDCAGGFKSEALGITLCDSIASEDPTALVGLPLIRLSTALRQAGFELP